MIEFFFPNSAAALLQLFVQIGQMGSHFAQMGSHFAHNTITNPYSLLSLLRSHTFLSRVCRQHNNPPESHLFSWPKEGEMNYRLGNQQHTRKQYVTNK